MLSIALLLLLLVTSTCSTTQQTTSSPQQSVINQHPTTNASLWMQNAAEYQSVALLIYQVATSNLGLAIEDSYWTAYPNQQGRDFQGKPPAIILDVDETVLNNAPFQARMIKQNSSFNLEEWNKWVMEAKAEPVPGSLEFAKRADEEEIAVFYVTNREAKVEAGTRKNLRNLGYPLTEGEDRILSKKERENWTSAKTERRAFVAENYRILMIFGDDLNDFISAKDISQQKRKNLVEQHQDKWGRQWYILPNPVYGSWENALYEFDNSLSPSEIDSIKSSRLDAKWQEK